MRRQILGFWMVVLFLGCGGGGGGGTDSSSPLDTSTSDLSDLVKDAEENIGPGWDIPSGPKLVVSPYIIDFGYAPYDETVTVDLTIDNSGNHTLTIAKDGIALDPASPDFENIDIQILGGTAKAVPVDVEGLSIEPGESMTFTLQWTAKNPVGNQGDPIGHLIITSNDSANGLVTLDIFGRVETPVLTLIPASVDFGHVGIGVTAQRTLTLSNEGKADLIVNEAGGCLEIVDDSDGEFAFVDTLDGWGPTTKQSCAQGIIPANDQHPVTLTCTPKSASGTATAKLVFTTNQMGMEEVGVPMTCNRAGEPKCEPAFVPEKLDSGVIPMGFYKDVTLKLMNDGTGDCQIQGLLVEGCAEGGPCPCEEPGLGTASECFALLNTDDFQAGSTLGPGSSKMIKLRVQAPASGNVLQECAGLLSATLYDPYVDDTFTIPVEDPVSGCWAPNLGGVFGIPKVLVTPQDNDFGKIAIGCSSETRKICVYNIGNAPLTVSDIQAIGCSPEFKLGDLPILPVTLPAGWKECFTATYLPQDEGPDSCQISVKSNDADDPEVLGDLKGEGVWCDHVTDTFVQAQGKSFDLLLVMDDSGSMCGMQPDLSGGIDALVQTLDLQEVDYHLGVISMNVVDDAVRGRLNEGDPDKVPLFVTQDTPDPAATFEVLADLGCDGGPNCGGLGGGCTDEQEAGLYAMWHALTPPLVDGWNAGFLRKDAQLEIVAISSEDDQGPFDAPFYADFLKMLKGEANANLVHFSAVTGLDPATCELSTPGFRYLDVAAATGGTVVDICTQGLADIVNSVGVTAQTPKTQFFLTLPPGVGTIQVRVDGVPCLDGWTYDATSNAIVFEPDGACWPGPGAVVEVEYDVACTGG